MFFNRRPTALPARDYPLVLRHEWLIDGNRLCCTNRLLIGLPLSPDRFILRPL